MMTLADRLYQEIIKKIPTAVRQFGAEALASQILQVTKGKSESADTAALADQVIKNLKPKTNEDKTTLSDDEIIALLTKLLRVVTNVSTPEQFKSSKQYYNLVARKLGKDIGNFYTHANPKIKKLALNIDRMIEIDQEPRFRVANKATEGQIYSTGGGAGQSYRKFKPKVDKTLDEDWGSSDWFGALKDFKRDLEHVKDPDDIADSAYSIASNFNEPRKYSDDPWTNFTPKQLLQRALTGNIVPKELIPTIEGILSGEISVRISHELDEEVLKNKLSQESSIMKGLVNNEDSVNEDLHKWFKEKWVRFGPDGKIRGSCARGSDSEGKPKCLPQKKAQALGKKGRASAAARKRRQDPNPERRGKAKNVATKKKSNESVVKEAKNDVCPPATQDIKLNLKNRQKAINEFGYGPLNPDLPNQKFWMKKAQEWQLDNIREAKKSLCGNCAAFNKSPEMLSCIEKGIGGENYQDPLSTIEAGDLGYCQFLKFKCASRRTCDAWVVGGPITSNKKSIKKRNDLISTDKQGVAEAVTPSQQLRLKTLYHGTSTKAAYEKILNQGIQSGSKLSSELMSQKYKGDDSFVPIKGGVYLTTDFGNAVRYSFMSEVPDEQYAEYIKQEPYGYVFEVSGEHLTNITADEDELGIFLEKLVKTKNLTPELLKVVQLIPKELREKLQQSNGDFKLAAIVGKYMMDHISDTMMQHLIKLYKNIVNYDDVKPIAVWVIKKPNERHLRDYQKSFNTTNGYSDYAKKVGKRYVLNEKQGVSEGKTKISPEFKVGDLVKIDPKGKTGWATSGKKGKITELHKDEYGEYIATINVQPEQGASGRQHTMNIDSGVFVPRGSKMTLGRGRGIRTSGTNTSVPVEYLEKINDLRPDNVVDIGRGRDSVSEGSIKDLDIDLQDQRWDAIVGYVINGLKKNMDIGRMELYLYKYAGKELFDIDQELQDRGFRDIADLADHIKQHNGRYVPPRDFDLGKGVAEGKDIHWRVEQSDATGRYYVVTGYTDKSRKVWKSKQGAGDFVKQSDAKAKANELNQGVAEGSLNEFAPSAGGGESGRWYTDDQLTDIVGDGWWNDLDVSGDISKMEMIQRAQDWLDDQGYSVQVLNCRLNDDDMDWYIEGTFYNPRFAKKGVADSGQGGVSEGQLNEKSPDQRERWQAQQAIANIVLSKGEEWGQHTIDDINEIKKLIKITGRAAKIPGLGTAGGMLDRMIHYYRLNQVNSGQMPSFTGSASTARDLARQIAIQTNGQYRRRYSRTWTTGYGQRIKDPSDYVEYDTADDYDSAWQWIESKGKKVYYYDHFKHLNTAVKISKYIVEPASSTRGAFGDNPQTTHAISVRSAAVINTALRQQVDITDQQAAALKDIAATKSHNAIEGIKLIARILQGEQEVKNIMARIAQSDKLDLKNITARIAQSDKLDPGVKAKLDDIIAGAKDFKEPDQNFEGKKMKENVSAGLAEGMQPCPECGGAMYEASLMNEKKDACYYKVKSRYKVWPSAYASGALVKCRKKGAKNWGKSTTKENKGLPMPGTYEQEYNMFKKKGPERITAMTSESEEIQEKWSAKYKRSINCNNPKGFSQRAHCQGRKKKAK